MLTQRRAPHLRARHDPSRPFCRLPSSCLACSLLAARLRRWLGGTHIFTPGRPCDGTFFSSCSACSLLSPVRYRRRKSPTFFQNITAQPEYGRSLLGFLEIEVNQAPVLARRYPHLRDRHGSGRPVCCPALVSSSQNRKQSGTVAGSEEPHIFV